MKPLPLFLSILLLLPSLSFSHDKKEAHQPDFLKTIRHKVQWIAEVKVLSVQGRKGVMGTKRAPAIWSDVRFQLQTLLYKSPKVPTMPLPTERTLSFPGGTVGSKSMHVTGIPRFQKGEHLLLFATPQERYSPSYRGVSGVLRIRQGRVYSYHNLPVTQVTNKGIFAQSPKTSPYKKGFMIPQGRSSGKLLFSKAPKALLLSEFKRRFLRLLAASK